MNVDYQKFIESKAQSASYGGFDPVFMPHFMFDFQSAIVDWAVRKGRAAIFADCGLGKTPMQLVWAQNVVMHTNRPVLILTPLAVASQTEREAAKFGIEARQSRDGSVAANITISNYEQLHKFNPDDFAGVVCDESSILKSFHGKTRKVVTRFMSKMQYRLLCTATAAPNDYIELGTSSEALGELTYTEMLRRYFKYLDDKGQKKEQRLLDGAERMISHDQSYYMKLSYRVSQSIGQWRLKHHAITSFWRWVASWAKACRMPSDLGFDDNGFILPELIENEHVVKCGARDGMLFNLPAIGLGEEREERKRTLNERCEYAARLVDHPDPAVIWCHANDEGDLLESVIHGASQIAGCTPIERKIELYEAFQSGELTKLVIKPKIGAWGLNWQHCNHVVTFASHSYEQYYQSLRRCYRFGQTRPVTVDVICTEGEVRVLENMKRKSVAADLMFRSLINEMKNAEKTTRAYIKNESIEVPKWV